MAEGEIVSANVVGYTQNPVANFMFIGPDFINCNGTEDITLADLPFNVVEDELEPTSGWMPNMDTINILNEDGDSTEQLVYINQAWASYWEEASGYSMTVAPGWYELVAAMSGDFSDPRGATPITFGTAIQIAVYSGNADAAASFSGQVKADPTFTDLAAFMAIANCSPVDVALSNLVFNAVEDELEPTTGWMPNMDTINILNEDGDSTEQLVYINQAWASYWEEASGYSMTVAPGWYELVAAMSGDFSAPRGDFEIKNGEGIQIAVYSGNTDVTVQVDSALK